MGRTIARFAGTVLGVLALCSATSAQQTTIGVPQYNINDGYWNFFGPQWMFFGPGFMMTGNSGLQPPEFGGFDPNSTFSTGMFSGGGGTGLGTVYSAGAGRNTMVTSTTPLLTVTNGIPGSMFAGTVTPLATGVMPVPGIGVAGNPAFNNLGPANMIDGRMQRGEFHVNNGQVVPGPAPGQPFPADLAAQPNLFPPVGPVPPPGMMHPEAEAQLRRQAMEQTNAAIAASRTPGGVPNHSEELWQKGQRLEAEGKPGAARLLYQSALLTAPDDLRVLIEARLKELR